MNHREKGFSIIEMLIALVISSIVMAGVYRVFIVQAKTYETQEVAADSQNAVRVGMQLMIDDLRMAGYDKEGGGSNVTVPASVPVHTAGIVKVQWEQDNDTVRAVQYSLSNGQLVRDVWLNAATETQVVLDDVTGLAFTCMGGVKVTGINVTLTVKNRTLQSFVILRNTK